MECCNTVKPLHRQLAPGHCALSSDWERSASSCAMWRDSFSFCLCTSLILSFTSTWPALSAINALSFVGANWKGYLYSPLGMIQCWCKHRINTVKSLDLF